MIKWISTLAVAFFFSFSIFGQTHQPSLEDCKLMFQDYYYLKDWKKAQTNLEYIIENSPNEGEKYFIKGVKVYEFLMKDTDDATSKIAFQQKALDLYQLRLSIYGNSDKVQNQYLSSIYRYWISQPAKYDSLASLFQVRFDDNIETVSQSNLLAYFDVMRRAKKHKQSFDEELVLTNYDRIAEQIRLQGDQKGYMEKIDQMLLQSVDLNCDKVEEIYGQSVAEPNQAKRYLNMIFRMDCEVNDKAQEALSIVLEADPDYKLAMYAAKKATIDRRLGDAQKFLGIALQQATSSDQEGDVYMELAKTMTLKEKKQDAYKYAKQAIAKNNNKEAYKLIGNLYMSSFSECVGEKDIVARRAIFIAAYDKFKMINDEKNMAIAEAQFPTMEEIHFNRYELGQSLIVDCWFKEEVVVARRPVE
ncbi:tetratricopeptide repeat protein [Reichenbachiella sp.]|uniref:tetratricopeptide repeat protein n=1 Tax=Reichenbachiella sp. TaxID=2184521 RepID=UPI003B5C2AE8